MSVLRSYLFVPARQLSMIRKAIQSEADCIIIDLEDAVVTAEKESAREIMIYTLQELKGAKPIYVRINDTSTPFWEEDITSSILNGASGVVVPKSESKEQMIHLCERVVKWLSSENAAYADGTSPFDVIPLIETAKGVQHVDEIAGAHSFISNLAFGSIDYSLDIGCELTPEGKELIYPLSKIVVASRAAEIGGPIDAVYPDLSNHTGLVEEAKRSKNLGFKGKLIIHPKQLEAVNQLFAPSEREVQQAREIVDEFEKAELSGKASITVDGRLVDYPVYKKAKEIVSLVNY
ncbi:HpcH/HpaI aldolase/citrate lyase family protein [Halobacillus naozhouensis]|uniref:CoA ester lyase n=1 Tax=Halobacillus naozhouensis TaxID=554880 RepID=A0ABY8J7H6_9BACI|nr:CoA ester lyase [Halobacillus naozhouensis]WFT76821.1 CoA ester lyase [Halobacillus naozhouensis]